MQPIKRPLFICSEIEKCREKVDCCAHKIPHIKDERCVPRECRYALGAGSIDCDLHDPEHPRVPIPEPIETRTVEQMMKEKEVLKNGDSITVKMSGTIEPATSPVEETPQEQDIKEAVKEAAQRPVTIIKPAHKKGGRRKS
jgi:hypothetical protein